MRRNHGQKAVSDSDHFAGGVEEASNDVPDESNLTSLPSPSLSPNPATNALIADIVLRGVSKLSRETVEAVLGVSKAKGSPEGEAPNKPSLVFSLAAMGATKLATRSLPGFAVVSAGLLAKTLFDRSQNKRKTARARIAAQQEQADPDGTL